MKRRTSYLFIGILFIVAGLAIGYVGFAQEAAKAPAAPETKQLDEVTALRLQNIQLQMTILQKDAQDAIDKFMKANKLDPAEWTIDLQKMVITKKAAEKK